MTWYKKDGKWLKEDGKWAISENCCCGDYLCVRDRHNYHVYSGDFAEDEPFYYSTKPDGGDPQPMLAAQNADDEWVFCAESAEPNDGNGIYIILELPEEGEELEENDIFTVYPLGGSEGYRCREDCECFHLDEKKCCNECDGQTSNMRCIRSWEFDVNTMEFIAAHADEQKCYDNCGKWYCFGDQQCCEDDDEDCDEDTIDYSCRFGSADDGNKLSGPYLEESKCTENCKEPPECPTCVKEACKYTFDPPPQCEDPETDPPDCEDLPGQGGGWANCCDDLRERWRYQNEDWVLLHPCSEDFNAPPGAGTPACKVTTREFPANPEENAIKDFPCEIDWEFEPPEDNEACGETGGCGYSCVELECEEGDEDCDEDNLESQCERDPSGNRKTLEECENKCPEKWKCTAVNECELNGDGEYETEEECVNRSVQKCGAYGACCFDGECEDGYLEQECIDEGGVYYGTSWCNEDPCGVPKWGTCCSFPYTNSGPQPANTEEEAKKLAAQSASANSAALPNSTWTIGCFKDGEWFEDAALFDPARNEWTCTGYWTTGNPATCTDVDDEDACKGPFKVFTQGNACEIDSCPAAPPPGPIGCCYTASLDNAGKVIYLQSKATDKECYEFQLLSDPDLEYKWTELEDPNDPCPDEPPPELGCCYVDIGDGTLQSQGRTIKADCQASQDEVDPSIECTWIADTEETNDPCPDEPTVGACCYPDGAIPAHCHDGEPQVECESAGGTWHEGKVCNEDGECPPVDPPALGRCCGYSGEQLTIGCADTRQECIEDAEKSVEEATNIAWFDEASITGPDSDPEADCVWTVNVYEYIPESEPVVCFDEDEDGNPVTQDFCDAYSQGIENLHSVFTEGEDCGGDNTGPGTCPAAPSDSLNFAEPP